MLDPYSGEPAEFLFEATDNRGFPGRFRYWRGPRDHVFIEAVPPDLDRHYGGGYQPIPADEAELAKVATGDAYRLDPIRALVPAGRFLEIGPWIGLVAYSARQAGYQVTAIEKSAECVDLLNRSGVEAIRSDDPAATLRAIGRRFDVIGLWHSIEHLPRPWEVIDAAARALAPGGLLVVAAPNPESAQLRLLGARWLHLDAPRHLHLLPAAIILEIGERAGLRLVERTTDDRLGTILDRNGWMFEINRRVRRLPLIGRLQRRRAARMGARVNTETGAAPPSRLARLRLERIPQALFRRRDGFDGAGFTILLQRPSAADDQSERPQASPACHPRVAGSEPA